MIHCNTWLLVTGIDGGETIADVTLGLYRVSYLRITKFDLEVEQQDFMVVYLIWVKRKLLLRSFR